MPQKLTKTQVNHLRRAAIGMMLAQERRTEAVVSYAVKRANDQDLFDTRNALERAKLKFERVLSEITNGKA